MYKKIFITDIERLLLIDTLWSNRTKPSPLSVDLLGKISKKELDDTKVWDVLDNLCSLSAATAKLQNRIAEESFISFDKDDEETLDFVVCAANLRSSIFSIDILSKFDIKQIAGNIIPAIATTNAIISGFSNLESLNYLRESKLSDAAMVFISIRPNKYVTSASLEQPRDTCGSCSIARGIVSISEGSLSSSLESFVDKIKETYLYGDISLILGNSKLIYDFDFEDNLEKNLTEIGFNKGETIQIQDEDDELETLELLIDVRESKQKEGITLPTLTLRPKVIRQAEEDKVDGETNGDIIDSGEVFDTIVIDDEQEGEKIEEVEEGEEVQEPIQKKRRVD